MKLVISKQEFRLIEIETASAIGEPEGVGLLCCDIIGIKMIVIEDTLVSYCERINS